MGTTLLGIDIGTTGIRVVLHDREGRRLAEASRACGHAAPSAGLAEIDPEQWWDAVCHALAELDETHDLADVAGVAVVGQAPTAVLLDDAGRAVRPAILWLDTRAAAEARELGTDAYYLGPKLLWLSRHEPESVARAAVVLDAAAFVVFRLTGVAGADLSTATLTTPLFDPETRTWSADGCARVGLDPRTLPPLSSNATALGNVTPMAAGLTGIAEGTSCVLGGGDFAAATLGAGVLDEGEACLMLGTAGNLLVPRREPGRDRRLINAHHVGVERWLSLGGTLSGGAQEWLRHALSRASGVDVTSVRSALPSFEALDAEAAQVPAGSEGLLFLPYLQGERTPIWDPHARGAYVGLGLRHGRGHLWRALLEGVALSFLDCLEVVRQDGVEVRAIIATDGGGKSPLFRQILCDVLGVPLLYAPDGGGTGAGAALLAGLAVGLVSRPEAARSWRGPLIQHTPDERVARTFRALLHVRRQAYDGLGPVFAALGS